MLILPIAVFVLFTCAGLILYSVSRASARRHLMERTSDAVDTAHARQAAVDGRQLTGIDNSVRNFRFHIFLTHELRKANFNLRVSEFLTLTVVCATIPAAIAHFALHRAALTGLLCIVGLLLPTMIMKERQAARKKAFANQLIDALTLLSNSIKSGYSFLQAIDLAAREMPPPISEEFARVIHDTNYGIPFETAVNQLIARMENDDLDLILTCVIIQRQVGGNLAEILDKSAHTIRERTRIKGQVRTLTAQGRLSGLILSLMPVAVALMLLIVNPDYVSILFYREIGRILLVVAACSQLLGIFLIRRIVTIEV